MSPASKCKSKNKLAAKTVKETPRVSSKSSPANNGSGTLAIAYNPVLGTFHSLEPTSPSLVIAHHNGRFRTINETEEVGSSFGITEYDSASNNGSCSGESEDSKEKMVIGNAPRRVTIPSSDSDKCDKIRQKNERKHQRQKERRSQELHERCIGYLMSRKLEMLSQQLVVMGFSSDQATMALILNEGRVEESVAWLFEGCEENKQHIAMNIEDGVNIKIDITDELARVADLEMRLKCTKQEVERAIVACEGDLEKAKETLKAQKQGTAASAKLEASVDHRATRLDNNTMTSGQNPILRSQVKGVASVSTHRQQGDERDLNCANAAVTGTILQEVVNRNSQPKLEWARPQAANLTEKRWPRLSSSPTVSCSLASPQQATVQPTKESMSAMVDKEVMANLQAAKPSFSSISVLHPPSTGTMKVANGRLGYTLPNLGINGSSSLLFYPQSHLQPVVSSHKDSGALSASSSSSLVALSSLGLFTRPASSRLPYGSSSPADWSTGRSMVQCDYTCIDWSLELTPLRPSAKSNHDHRSSDPFMFMGGRPARLGMSGGYSTARLQGTGGGFGTVPFMLSGSHEWTSPFAGRDLLVLPRELVTSPSL